MLNLHFDPRDNAGQTPNGNRDAIGSQRPPDFEPLQVWLNINWNGVTVLELLPSSKHSFGQIP
nr:hypothetical protein [Erythrobacter sp. QSSC1-22B]